MKLIIKYTVKFCLLLLFLPACKNKSAGEIISVQRDTTITPEQAFTRLTLDSLKVDAFIKNEVIQDSNDFRIRNFYNLRNYQYAWFNEEGLTEHAGVFWQLHQHQMHTGVDSFHSKLLHEQMEAILNDDTTYSAETIADIELRVTQHFFKYIHSTFDGKVEPEEMQWHIPRRKVTPLVMLDSFLADKEWKPLNQSFYRLHSKLDELRNQNWSTIAYKKKLRKGMTDTAVVELKKRLMATGEFVSADSGKLFTDELEEAVKKSQQAFGFTQDGIADQELVKALNVSVEARIQQVLVNLERMRWMPQENKNRIIANIPEYKLHVYEKDSAVLNIKIVVGKAANRTVIFSDELKYVVFSPHWNIPRSITRNEIVPAMKRSSSYLRRNNMEITGHSNGLPVVRQKPGRGNALGLVKFLFPNSYNIYFHDTPAKSLFEKEGRAFSHGCIRLQKPADLAKYLLRHDESWTDKEIKKAMNRSTEKWVTLPEPIPVFIVYFTSWVDKEGLLHFRDDIYGHDKKMKKHLFE